MTELFKNTSRFWNSQLTTQLVAISSVFHFYPNFLALIYRSLLVLSIYGNHWAIETSTSAIYALSTVRLVIAIDFHLKSLYLLNPLCIDFTGLLSYHCQFSNGLTMLSVSLCLSDLL